MAASEIIRVFERAEDLERAAASSGEQRRAVVRLSSGGGTGRKGFFDAVRRAVVLDPPVDTERSWDGLEDSLWSGLFQLPETHILVVWPDASGFASTSPEEYTTAIDVLESVGKSLMNERATAGAPKHVEVLIS